MKLPKKSSAVNNNIDNIVMLLYGEPKIGKTSFASEFPDALFCMFEPGGKFLSIRQVSCNTWKDFLDVIKELKKSENKNYCKNIIIDTGHEAYEKCFDYVLDDLGIDSPGDSNFGEAWKMIEREFQRAHVELIEMGIGLIVTAHVEEQEIIKHGLTRHKTIAKLGKQARRFYTGICDLIAYYHFDDNEKRQLRIRGNNDYLAGCRVVDRFLYSSGEPIDEIAMGNSSKEAYSNFVVAFNNQLSKGGKKDEVKKIGLGGLVTKKKKRFIKNKE